VAFSAPQFEMSLPFKSIHAANAHMKQAYFTLPLGASHSMLSASLLLLFYG
jgi:hypothetical protein